jgi:hypothetical protein
MGPSSARSSFSNPRQGCGTADVIKIAALQEGCQIRAKAGTTKSYEQRTGEVIHKLRGLNVLAGEPAGRGIGEDVGSSPRRHEDTTCIHKEVAEVTAYG